jgi:Tol biopolymer transport system component
LYKNPAIFLMLSDWSLDGRFLSFAANVSGGVLYILPLTGEGERKPIEVYRSEGGMFGPRFSPDGRFLAYVLAREGHRNEVFVRPIDASAGTGSWQVSEGSRGSAAAGFQDSATLVSWRRDGKELRYLGPDLSVMAVAIGTSPTFKFGRPKMLFRPPGAVPIFIGDISRDGERFIALPPPKGPQLQQITVFDREGKIVSKVGVPGLYAQPAFSPDGTRLVVMREYLATGNRDIWTFDVATGKGTQVTNDLLGENTPIWSLDGTQILFVSKRGGYSGVYRRPWDGTGSEELLFRYTPGAGLGLTDVSPDGKFLVCGSGGVVLVVALTGTDPVTRKALEFSREEFDVAVGRISPDGLFMAFRSDEANPERGEVYVRPFDASTGGASEGKWRVSKDGVAAVNDWSLGNAMLHWRRDGKELFFRGFNEPGSDDLRVMSVDVATTPAFQAGTPKLLFKLPGPQSGSLGSISRDGQRFVFALNVPAATTAN